MSPVDPRSVVEALRSWGDAVSLRELLAEFDVSPAEKTEFRALLKGLEKKGEIVGLGGSRWAIASAGRPSPVPLRGVLLVTKRGTGVVRLDEESRKRLGGKGELLVAETDLADALDGDTVAVRPGRASHRGETGRIVEVLKRARTTLVGMYQRSGRDRAMVLPKSPAIPRRVFVPIPDEKMGIKEHEWVVVKITEFTNTPDALLGEVVERLGASHEKGIDVLVLLRDQGFVQEFPEGVEQEAAQLDGTMKVTGDRADFRDMLTATIDPKTAKDFDDALSIEPLDNGGWRLFVHIADVAHFVRPDTLIDHEARERSTSVYPVDRVIPMLPERLSNDLCSLREGVDRYSVTAEMIVSSAGDVTDAKFHNSVIRSNQRLTYEQVQGFFNEDAEVAAEVHGALHESLHHLRDCTRALRARRFKRGALDLDIPELQIVFHEDGSVSHVKLSERFEAHQLVEDCMLAANEAVARHLEKKKAPALYRIHEAAEPERLEQLAPVFRALDVPLRISKKDGLEHGALQAAIRAVEDRPGGHILRRLVLRSLKRARYSVFNAGHFGLASKSYCHFTSPIRRYPDTIVHRQLKALIAGGELPYPREPEVEGGNAELFELANHTSARERAAEDAERDSETMKAIEYLEEFVGTTMDGMVSGVQPFGLFIELRPHGIEGLVAVRTLRDDHYEIDELGIALIGRRTGRAYRLLDEVKVKLVKTDAFAGQVDLELVESGRGARKATAKPFYAKQVKKGKKRR